MLWERIETRRPEGRFGARPIDREELQRWAAAFERPDHAELRSFDGAT